MGLRLDRWLPDVFEAKLVFSTVERQPTFLLDRSGVPDAIEAKWSFRIVRRLLDVPTLPARWL